LPPVSIIAYISKPPDSKVDIFCNIYIKIKSIRGVIKKSGTIVYNLSWKMNKLILFDIDGTLITSGGAGVRALNRAFQNIFGPENAFENVTMAGKTDKQIMKEGIELHGFSHDNGKLQEMVRMYLEFLQEEIENPWRKIKPGIKEALDSLRRSGAVTGLLTGNLREGAKIKLGPFGLFEYFLDGAFGSDDEDRDRLLPIAIDKFLKKGHEFSPGDCVVVGDTPRDVKCAKVHGALSIAVATGPYSREQLHGTGADLVLDSFKDSGEYMDFFAGI
jgi:phosphoglycolate phosphatase-like HAD superfamily hydrolase